MPRKMSEEKEMEFDELSMFLEYFCTHYEGIDRDDKIHPSNVLVKIVAEYGKSKALQGLKQAVNDTIEATQDFKEEKISEIDQALSGKGIVTLSSLRQKYWRKYNKVIKQKTIKNETEYYLINGVLSDIACKISGDERNLLNRLITEYEDNYA